MVKEILQIGAPILTKSTKKIESVHSSETRRIVTDLLDTCLENADKSAGLAAPQIGYDVSICVCRRIDLEDQKGEGKVSDKDLWEVLINPEVIYESTKTVTNWEGCLSIGEGDENIWGPVTRPARIEVNYTKPDGKTAQITGKDYFSSLIQHELDHLDGILFLSYVTNPKNLWRLGDLQKQLNKTGDYPEILK